MNFRTKTGWLLVWILLACSGFAQTTEYYKVTGGQKGTPVLADDNTRERIQVYLVYGMQNVQLSFTSQSASHQWYRYRTRPGDNDAELVASTQNGTTSVVTNVEEGYGYFVREVENWAMNRFVWVIDYSKYELDIRNFSVMPDFDECDAIRFEGDADIPLITYNMPLSGSQETVKRVFELSYGTLEWDEASKRFMPATITKAFDTHPFETTFMPHPNNPETDFPLILKDTEIALSGDLYARHFGVEKPAVTLPYTAKAIEIYADTTITSPASARGVELMSGELEAPVDILFQVYANVPVASRFMWKIIQEDTEQPVYQQNAEDFTYSFTREGRYTVMLEANDRSGMCVNEDYQFEVWITETVLEIPNAFSPGTSPGKNDIFRVKYKSVVKFQGWIFNRWGVEMFSWNDPAQGWDGKYRGQYVPAGAYYYLIEYTGTDGKKRTRKGDVNVFRSKSIQTQELEIRN